MYRAMLMGLWAVWATAGAAHAQGDDPVVVELFTSQGCSSCPPADANLVKLSARPDVLALSFGVTYWNYLGWEDTFARPEFTQRQFDYERPLGHAGAFTPQIVVNGARDTVGHDLGEIEALIADAAAERAIGPAVTANDERVTISAGAAPAGPADIWLVRYDPGLSEVPVARGENRRRVLTIAHAVRELTRLGTWNGTETVLALPPASSPAGSWNSALLVQLQRGGPILAARKLGPS
ncbi:DUF1223 domain-containing protein [Dongia sp.]|uniref:DUF1223 domain-containing protein n=1 Tax=Dongia sp. TaxID=1977262 RepID=UPI0035B0FC45